jgi:threonine/homoserine/homoserine lactone efflux protein
LTLNTWWLFILMTFVVSATPGPNMLLIMSLSARHGLRAAVIAMGGCMTALLAMMGVSAAGMGAVLQSSPQLFEVLRLAGAAYLAYLGIKVWCAPVQGPAASAVVETGPGSIGAAPQAAAPTFKTAAIYRQAFLVAASNPKAILFAAAFFPQFIHAESDQFAQVAILLGSFTVIEVSWYFVYAISGKRLSKYLQRTSVMRGFNRMTGGIFVGFAALMAVAKS